MYGCDIDGDGDNDLISASSYDGNRKVVWYENSLITDIESNYEPLARRSPLSIINYELKQNYPNPFNPHTRINYELAITNYELAEIVIHNSMGQSVWSTTVGSKNFSSISESIHGSIEFDGSKFNSGIYYYSLIVDGKQLATKSMLLIK